MSPPMIAAMDAGGHVRNWRHPALVGYVIIILAFGVLGGWSAIAKLDRAVVAPATVSIDTNRKLVQHLEGGIVKEILVREGQVVEAGDVLIRLDDVQARAGRDTVRNQLLAAETREARLTAERDELPQIVLPNEVRENVGNPVIANAIADEAAQFDDRRRSLQSQVDILQQRAKELETEIHGLEVEQDSTEKQVGFIHEELDGLRELLALKLVAIGRVLSMERERSRLEGDVGHLIAEQAKARDSIGETNLQIEELKHKFQEETAASILDTRQKIADLREKLAVERDILTRLDVRAPRSGKVQGLKVANVGQVIRPGEALLEIVPTNEPLIVQARFSPNDIASVHSNHEAEVRFPAFHSRSIPVITGMLESVSSDRLLDDQTHQPYYLGLVSVDRMKIPAALRADLRAGMPAEVIVSSGERTALSYLISPLAEALRKTFREP